jgi:hypothetical protein
MRQFLNEGGDERSIYTFKRINYSVLLSKREELPVMKKVVITIIMFAIAIGLIIGVILPIASHGKATGQTAKTRMTTVDGEITTLMQPIN